MKILNTLLVASSGYLLTMATNVAASIGDKNSNGPINGTIPEPGALGLLAAGAAVAFLIGRKRRK